MSFKGQNLGEAPVQRPETQPGNWEEGGSNQGGRRDSGSHMGTLRQAALQDMIGMKVQPWNPDSCSQLRPPILSFTYKHYSKQLCDHRWAC